MYSLNVPTPLCSAFHRLESGVGGQDCMAMPYVPSHVPPRACTICLAAKSTYLLPSAPGARLFRRRVGCSVEAVTGEELGAAGFGAASLCLAESSPSSPGSEVERRFGPIR